MGGVTTFQPFKALYVLLAVAFEVARFPYWILKFIPVSGRPHKQWSHQQAIRLKIVRLFLRHSSAIETRTPTPLKPGSEKGRFVTFDPAPSAKYKGPAVDKAGEIKPTKTGSTWTPKPISASEDKSNVDVVLHFHGGAYVIGDGRDHDTGFLAKTMLKHAKVTHVFTPQYRLSSNPGGRFPAQFQDAISSYYYLVETLKIPADRITISGDSAGGNLAFALLRYISEYGSEVGLPSPGCAWLWSPWVDVNAARDPSAMEKSPHYETDYLTASFGIWGANTFAPPNHPHIDGKSPYISPINHPFKSKTPIWVQTGDAEILYEDDVEIAGQFKKIDGNKVELWVSQGCPHDIILVGPIAGFANDAGIAAKKAGEFLRTERARL